MVQTAELVHLLSTAPRAGTSVTLGKKARSLVPHPRQEVLVSNGSVVLPAWEQLVESVTEASIV